MWKLIHPGHAIETMAFVVQYAEPVSSLVLRRIIRELERTTSVAGLIDRQPTQSFQIDMANAGQVRTVKGDGMIFQRSSLVRHPTGVMNQLMEQIDCQPNNLVYRTWQYTRWNAVSKGMIEMIKPAFSLATQNVAISSVRLEYLDRFIFEGEQEDATAKDLINSNTKLVSPHIFDAKDLFHSHVGTFEPATEDTKRLIQVNVDGQEVSGPHLSVGKRSIAIMSSVEDRYPAPGKDLEGDDAPNFLVQKSDDLHKRVKSLFMDVTNSAYLATLGMEL